MKKVKQHTHEMHHNHSKVVGSATTVKMVNKLSNDTTDRTPRCFNTNQHGKNECV